MKTQHKVWIIEDEKSSQFVYEEILGMRYDLKIFNTLKEFKDANSSEVHPDALIADLRLPDGDFLNYLKDELKDKKFEFPFFVVSSMDDLDALRNCFNAGAQDYITKPFGRNEIVVKLEMLFSGNSRGDAQRYVKDGCSVDLKAMTIQKGGLETQPLTAKEYQIFMLFLEKKNKPVRRKEIMDQIWKGEGISDESKTIDVHISRLRKKIAAVNLEIRSIGENMFTLCDWVNA